MVLGNLMWVRMGSLALKHPSRSRKRRASGVHASRALRLATQRTSRASQSSPCFEGTNVTLVTHTPLTICDIITRVNFDLHGCRITFIKCVTCANSMPNIAILISFTLGRQDYSQLVFYTHPPFSLLLKSRNH